MKKKNNQKLAEMFECILEPLSLLNKIVVDAEKAGEKPFDGEYTIVDADIDDHAREMGCARRYNIMGIQCDVGDGHILSLPIDIQTYEFDGDDRVRVFMDISAVVDGTILCTVSQTLNEEYVKNFSYLLGSSNSLTAIEPEGVAHA